MGSRTSAAIAALALLAQLSAGGETLPEGPGLAARYPGDKAIADDSAVVFAENFEEGVLAAVAARWNNVKNPGGKVLAFTGDVPEASAGAHSLRVTATSGENDGGHLFRLLKPGYDRLHLRFYAKFGAYNGFNHHFVSLGGEVDPPPYPVGRAGLRAISRFNSGIEPAGSPPPGAWHFYSYWPDMRSWQNEDGTGTSFYGNSFTPEAPAVVPRGRWVCVEIMLKMNTSPEESNGEQALWIDGKLMMHWAPGTVNGRWLRDKFRRDPSGEPFAGFRWRTDMRIQINKLMLSHFVSETAFERTRRYAAASPDFAADTRQTTVWFDDLVVATSYIGPIAEIRP